MKGRLSPATGPCTPNWADVREGVASQPHPSLSPHQHSSPLLVSSSPLF